MELTGLFFELIRVSVGTQEGLSRLPSEAEWDDLYAMAEKQSLVGICFAGLQNLGADADDGFTRIGMSELQYLNWMLVAATIQERNEVMNRQCGVLQVELTSAGFRSSILKGQGIASLYSLARPSSGLALLRQSGDIDIYVDGGREKAIRYAQGRQEKVSWDYKHLHLDAFADTPVELHYRPEYLANLVHNRRFQRWARENEEHLFGREVHCDGCALVTPDTYFNSVYVLAHIYNHNMRAGVGLRQLMDYYFVLAERQYTEAERSELLPVLNRLGLLRYASGVMWLLQTVFGLADANLLCAPCESEGRYILDGVLIGGNMGRGYEKPDKGGCAGSGRKGVGRGGDGAGGNGSGTLSGRGGNGPGGNGSGTGACRVDNGLGRDGCGSRRVGRFMQFASGVLRYSARSFLHYPLEALSYPIWAVVHFVWKRVWGLVKGV